MENQNGKGTKAFLTLPMYTQVGASYLSTLIKHGQICARFNTSGMSCGAFGHQANYP